MPEAAPRGRRGRAKQLVREYVLATRHCMVGRDDSGRCPEEEIAAAHRELKKLDKAEEHLVRLRVKGLASPRVLERQLLELKRERAAIETRIAKARLARERDVQRDAAQEDREDMLAAARGLLRGNETHVDLQAGGNSSRRWRASSSRFGLCRTAR